MGERAYFIDKVGDEWRAIYSHWGASDLDRWIKRDYEEACKKDIVDGAITRFDDFFRVKVAEEIEKGESWETIDINKFIDLTDITTEAYIIFNGRKYYIVRVFVNRRLNGGVVSSIFDRPYDNYVTLHIFNYYNNVTGFYDDAFKGEDDEKIKQEIKSHFHKRFFKPSLQRWLFFERVDRVILDVMTGRAFMIGAE